MISETLSRREFLRSSSAVASGAVLLSACGGMTSNGTVSLKFWNATYPTSDSNNKSKKKQDFYIYQAIKRFETENPGIKIQIQDVPGTVDMFTQYRVASIARNGPDVMGMWSGSYMLQFKQYLEPLNQYFTPKEMERIRGWSAVTEGFKEGSGQIYGIPNASDGIAVILYNKKLLANAGVDPQTNWPSNFDNFLSMLSKIKATGTTPLALYDNGYTFFSLDYWIAQMVNGDPGIGELVSGKRNFSDASLVEIAQKWSQLAQYTVPGAPTMDNGQAGQLIYQKKAAMTIGLPGDIPDMRKALGEDLGMHKLPDFSNDASVRDTGIGGAGTALIVSNYSKHKEEAVKFLKFLMSKPEQTKRAEAREGLINVTDVDVQKIYTDPLIVQEQQWVLEPSSMFWPDNIYPAELTNELSAQAQLAWTGKISPQQFMSKLDSKRDELLHTPKK